MSDLKPLNDKIDAALEQLSNINIKMAEYNTQLTIHIAGTKELRDLVLPLVRRDEQWKGAAKLATWIIAVLGVLGGLSWIWHR